MDLRPSYQWIVFVHVAAAFVFVLPHGVSVFASYPLGGPTCSPASEGPDCWRSSG